MQPRETLFSESVPVFMKSFGSLNPDKFFYVIWRESPGGGFFSNVFHVLSHLMYAWDLGLTPVVDMENFSTFYNEQSVIASTKNAWEYYFTQPSRFSLRDVYKSKRVVFCYGSGGSAFGAYYNFVKAGKMAERFLHVQPSVLAEVEAFRKEHFENRSVLGVHFRGQEMKTAKGHPAPPTEAQMLERTRELLQRFSIDKIYIVSEDQGYVDLFKNEFRERVLCTDSFRTHGENAYKMPPTVRSLHMYNLGREILRDTLLLSQTDYLLASGKGELAFGSGVSLMAQLWNGGRYRHMELVYNGINTFSGGNAGFAEFVENYFPNGVYRPRDDKSPIA